MAMIPFRVPVGMTKLFIILLLSLAVSLVVVMGVSMVVDVINVIVAPLERWTTWNF